MSAVLLDDVARFVRRFVFLNDDQAAAAALFIAHNHAFEAADSTPYLTITSAEKRSGKTRLLEVLELLAREPLPHGEHLRRSALPGDRREDARRAAR